MLKDSEQLEIYWEIEKGTKDSEQEELFIQDGTGMEPRPEYRTLRSSLRNKGAHREMAIDHICKAHGEMQDFFCFLKSHHGNVPMCCPERRVCSST